MSRLLHESLLRTGGDLMDERSSHFKFIGKNIGTCKVCGCLALQGDDGVWYCKGICWAEGEEENEDV